MSVEFVDTNVLVYAHDGGAGPKHARAVQLLERLVEDGTGALSTQILAEFYSVATKKLCMSSTEAEEIIADLGTWIIHRPAHRDLIRAIHLQRQHKLAWWDALVLSSAAELGCPLLWSEDLAHGHSYGEVRVANPFLD